MYQVLRIKYIIIFTLVGMLNTCYILPNTVYAEGTSLKMQPSNLQIRAQTPADVRAPFTLTNQSNEAVTLNILLKRFRDAGDETGTVVFSMPGIKTESDRDQFLKTVQVVDDGFVVPHITLGPKQQKKLMLRIELPKDSKAQDHYFSIIFLADTPESTEVKDDKQKETSSTIQTGISLPVLISVNQKKDPAAFLDEFSSPLILQSGPVPFTIKVENTGEHFVQTTGVILIKNMFGQTVGKVELPKTNILSDSTRSLADKSTDTKSLTTPTAAWTEPFLLGFYTATVTVSISPDESLYTRSIYFFAFPLLGSIILFASLLVGIFLIRRVKRKMA